VGGAVFNELTQVMGKTSTIGKYINKNKSLIGCFFIRANFL
jgi:hypothetical protein